MKRFSVIFMCVLQLTALTFGDEVNIKENANFKKALIVAENAVAEITIDNSISYFYDYYEKDFNGYWVFFGVNGISFLGDSETILLHKDTKNNWKYYFLEHDVTSPEIPKELLDDYKSTTFKRCYFYIGDKNAQVNKLSNIQIITKEDIRPYSLWSLKLMRDEIFARHGKIFNDKEANKFFLTRTWYKPNKNANDIKLNDIEKANLVTINEVLINKENEIKKESIK